MGWRNRDGTVAMACYTPRVGSKPTPSRTSATVLASVSSPNRPGASCSSDPGAELFMRVTSASSLDRFMRKVCIGEGYGPGECWPWTGATSTNGYGSFYDNGRSIGAHVASVGFSRGPTLPGLVIDHLCRNKLCVNPAHLEAVTSRENTLRGTSPSAIAATKTECPRGHPYDAANTIVVSAGRHRRCRSCEIDRDRARHARTKSDRAKYERAQARWRAAHVRRRARLAASTNAVDALPRNQQPGRAGGGA